MRSCGSSINSINPRRTSVPSVVRGTSSPRKASTGTRPPAAARASIKASWFALSVFIAVAGRLAWGRAPREPTLSEVEGSGGDEASARSSAASKTATFTRRAASRAADTSSRAIHFFRTIPASNAFATAPPPADCLRARSPAPPDNPVRGTRPVAVPESASIAPETPTSRPDAAPSASSVMRYVIARLNSAASGSMVRNTSPTGAR